MRERDTHSPNLWALSFFNPFAPFPSYHTHPHTHTLPFDEPKKQMPALHSVLLLAFRQLFGCCREAELGWSQGWARRPWCPLRLRCKHTRTATGTGTHTRIHTHTHAQARTYTRARTHTHQWVSGVHNSVRLYCVGNREGEMVRVCLRDAEVHSGRVSGVGARQYAANCNPFVDQGPLDLCAGRVQVFPSHI